ncbi:MAG TPA: DUF364 domain-containing protein [Syntrophomonadaceae bacterium]|nr:DUF364 domain-containing protein [Syntrophomonadaceae bacterium]
MKEKDFSRKLLTEFAQIVKENNLMNEEIIVTARTLSTEEAIGNPERQDYPIIKGKEKLIQADFKGYKGQAFTDMPGSFKGTIEEIVNQVPENNWDRGILIATMNAVCRYLDLIEGTIHCHDEEPEECASALQAHISQQYDQPKIALIGLQPAILEKLAEKFRIRTVDLDEDNIGKTKHGILIESFENTQEVLDWCDLIIATGSTAINNTMGDYVGLNKPVIFFGTSCAGATHLMDLERWCYKGS